MSAFVQLAHPPAFGACLVLQDLKNIWLLLAFRELLSLFYVLVRDQTLGFFSETVVL